MACGIPVACARAGALPEVAGDAALFFDEKSPEDIADAIGKIVHEEKGHNERFRADMISKGLEWVKNFSWSTCAKETLETVERV